MIGHAPSSSAKHPARAGFAITLALIGSLTMATGAAAQFPPAVIPPDLPVLEPNPSYPPTVATLAAGPFLPLSSLDQTLPPRLRFVILTNFGDAAVLDRETGLVWARQLGQYPSGFDMTWPNADYLCHATNVGGRMGWRLPTRAELLSLFEPGSSGVRHLPEGHPFVLGTGYLWTSETSPFGSPGNFIAWAVLPANGLLDLFFPDLNFNQALCVRGRS